MTKENSHLAQELIGGVVIGTAIGIAATYLIKTQGLQQIKEGLMEAYHQASEQAQSLAERAQTVSKDIAGHFFTKKPSPPSNSILLIGGIAGGILGISVARLFCKQGEGLCQGLTNGFHSLSHRACEMGGLFQKKNIDAAETMEERVGNWIKASQQLIANLNGTKNASNDNTSIDHALKWIGVGVRFFQSLKK